MLSLLETFAGGGRALVRLAGTVAAVALLTVACQDDDSAEPDIATAPNATQATVGPTATQQPDPMADVPARYQSAWRELDAAIAEFETTVKPSARPTTGIGTVSVSMVLANANRGPALFNPATLDAIERFLDEVKEMGVTGVELQIAFPVVQPGFPNNDQYLAFYKDVMAAVRTRGFSALVETGPIFANSEFTQLPVNYGAYKTTEDYFTARTASIVRIATELRPDYLAIGHEPMNERTFAGQTFTNAEYAAFVNRTVEATRDALGSESETVALGVGTGTWEQGLYRDLVKMTDVDFYDIHIYPLRGEDGNQLEVAREMARLARDKGRPAIIGETWLYKATSQDVAANSAAASAEIFRRDAFTFWEPLELRYIQAILGLGREFEMPFVSLWGAVYLFGQTKWTPEIDGLGYRQTMAANNPIAAQGILEGSLSSLGESFRQLIAGE